MKPLEFIEHPEGGRFCEVYRSNTHVQRENGQQRNALTHIYFKLESGEVSHYHRVHSDEIWNLYRGDGLYLFLWDGLASAAKRVTLSAGTQEYCHVVPPGTWQAAVPVGDSVMVGCSVAPGFDFVDFEMMRPDSDTAKLLYAHDPDARRLVKS